MGKKDGTNCAKSEVGRILSHLFCSRGYLVHFIGNNVNAGIHPKGGCVSFVVP